MPRTYVVDLYVRGKTARTQKTVERLEAILEDHVKGRYRMRVTDVESNPEGAERDKIIATPTLIRKRPSPVRRVVGNLADEDFVLSELDLQ